MKKNLLLFSGFIFWTSLLISSCTPKKDSSPCNNMGNLCIENKLDSEVTITLQPIHDQFPLQKDYMKCSQLDGNKPYTITITTASHESDTTIMILPCDNKLLIIK
jgi:hypothetical protein